MWNDQEHSGFRKHPDHLSAIASQPELSEYSGLRTGVPVNTWFRACGECGFVFSELSVAELIEQLARFPGARVKQWLNEKPDRPL